MPDTLTVTPRTFAVHLPVGTGFIDLSLEYATTEDGRTLVMALPKTEVGGFEEAFTLPKGAGMAWQDAAVEAFNA